MKVCGISFAMWIMLTNRQHLYLQGWRVARKNQLRGTKHLLTHPIIHVKNLKLVWFVLDAPLVFE